MTSKTQIANDPKFIAAFKKVGVGFLVRTRKFNYEQAKFEINLIIERLGLESFISQPKNTYLTLVRKGANVRLNRKDRLNVLLTLENVLNHSYVEAGYV